MFWLTEQVGGLVLVITGLVLTWRVFCWIFCSVGDFLDKHSSAATKERNHS